MQFDYRKLYFYAWLLSVYAVLTTLMIGGQIWLFSKLSIFFGYCRQFPKSGATSHRIFFDNYSRFSGYFSYTQSKFKRIALAQSWLIDTVNWHVTKLAPRGTIDDSGVVARAPSAMPDRSWPWGSHHTETLGHLDAAARKWWALYDPSDLTTAPTNEMVSDWLQDVRGISREKARAIASMLRPDGLPTGAMSRS